MTFSLRSILLVIAVVGIWLGAVLSQSRLAVELAAAATNLSLLFSVGLAIWHPNREQRIFWTGFCLLGIGSFVLSNYFSAYESTRAAITNAVVGTPPPPSAPQSGFGGSGFSGMSSSSSFSGPPGFDPYGGNLPYFGQQQVVLAAVPPIISLLLAGFGGWLMLWIARSAKAEPDK